MNKLITVGINKLKTQIKKDEITIVNSPIPAAVNTQIAMDSRIASLPRNKEGAKVNQR